MLEQGNGAEGKSGIDLGHDEYRKKLESDWLRSEFSRNPAKVIKALQRELPSEGIITSEDVRKLEKDINIVNVSGEPVMASSEDNVLLKTTGVFTCAALKMYAPDVKRGGFVHLSPGDEDRAGSVIETMRFDLIEKHGAGLKDLQIRMITSLQAYDSLKESIVENLNKCGLPKPEDDIWGGDDRNILFDVKTGETKEILYPDTINKLEFFRKELSKITAGH